MTSIRHIFHTGIFLLFVIMLLGCEKKDNLIGLDVQPESDKVIVKFDTSIVLTTSTIAEVPVSTTNLPNNLLGSISDPVFGNSKAEIVTQFRISKTNPRFGTDASLDSLILYLKYDEIFGDTNSIQDIKIYQLSEDLNPDSTYFSNAEVLYTPVEIAEFSFSPNSKKSILAIPLSNSFGESLLKADSTYYNSPAKFLEFFKGLYISTSQVSNGGAITYFDLESTSSKMTLYYKTDNDTLNFDYLINYDCVYFNKYTHDYTNSEFIDNLNDTTTDILYLQAMAGVRTQISLSNITLDNVAINKAELIINLEEGNTAPINNLILKQLTNDGKETSLLDDPSEMGDSYFGGNLDTQNNQYKLNITRYIQQVISEKTENPTLRLYPRYTNKTANRAILKSANQPGGMKLFVTYTEL